MCRNFSGSTVIINDHMPCTTTRNLLLTEPCTQHFIMHRRTRLMNMSRNQSQRCNALHAPRWEGKWKISLPNFGIMVTNDAGTPTSLICGGCRHSLSHDFYSNWQTCCERCATEEFPNIIFHIFMPSACIKLR